MPAGRRGILFETAGAHKRAAQRPAVPQTIVLPAGRITGRKLIHQKTGYRITGLLSVVAPCRVEVCEAQRASRSWHEDPH